MNEQKIINNALRYVLDLLEKVNHYPYHNINHTLDVYSRCDYLCDKEFVHLQDKTDILLAALFHDVGFIERYNNNEEISAKIAKEYLISANFEKNRIDNVEKIIMATVVGTKPSTKAEEIIQDADFDNLGRKDSLVKTMSLKKELKIINKINIPTLAWLESTYNLFRKHQFNTVTARSERNSQKLNNIKKLEQRMGIQKDNYSSILNSSI